MYIIAGLGNPGKEYENTRHNVGFHVIDCLADRIRTDVTEKKHFALCGKGMLSGEKVLLMKPQTYMNNSGQSLRAAADFYKVEPEHIIVVSDDINLEEGQLRIRLKGSAGGHNGLKSIIAHLGSQDFPRIRVGIGGKPEGWDLADYVLGKLKGNDADRMEEAYRTAADAVSLLIAEGGAAVMNQYNRKPEKAKPEKPKTQKSKAEMPKNEAPGTEAPEAAVPEMEAQKSEGAGETPPAAENTEKE